MRAVKSMREFGSCNSEDIVLCKCLPGFEPQHPDQWEKGYYYDGCVSKSPGDDFINFTTMKVGKPKGGGEDATDETECMKKCLSNIKCKAWSYIADKSMSRDMNMSQRDMCWRWSEDLVNIQEFAEGGANLAIRVSLQDIGPSPTSACLIYPSLDLLYQISSASFYVLPCMTFDLVETTFPCPRIS